MDNDIEVGGSRDRSKSPWKGKLTCDGQGDGEVKSVKGITGSDFITISKMHLPDCLHTNTTCILPPTAPPPPSLPFSLFLSPSVYVWCVVGENKEMEERRRQTKRVGLKPNVCRGASFTIVENQNTRGRIYPVDPFRTWQISFLYFDRHSLH